MSTYFATKFDSAAAEVVSILSDETEGFGTRDGSGGDVEAPCGYFALVHLDGDCDLDVANYPAGDRAGEVAREYGVTAEDIRGTWIVTTNSQGFVDVTQYDTRAEGDTALAGLWEAFEAWSTTPYDEV